MSSRCGHSERAVLGRVGPANLGRRSVEALSHTISSTVRERLRQQRVQRFGEVALPLYTGTPTLTRGAYRDGARTALGHPREFVRIKGLGISLGAAHSTPRSRISARNVSR